MASTSDGGEDKENNLDTNDVQLAIDEGHFVEPAPTGASASTHLRLLVPKAASESTEPSAQGRNTSDPLPTAVARRQASKKLSSALSAGEDPLTAKRHGKESTEVQTVHGLDHCQCYLKPLSEGHSALCSPHVPSGIS